MITKMSISVINYILDQIKDRNINFVKIEKKANEYYVEYKLGFNKSDKMIDLLSELEIFKECYEKGTISHFYLWYNVAFDTIISNTQTIKVEDEKATKHLIHHKLDDIKNSLSDREKDKKIVFTNGKKKISISVGEVVDLLICNFDNKKPVVYEMKSEE